MNAHRPAPEAHATEDDEHVAPAVTGRLFRRRRLRSNALANLSGRLLPGLLTVAAVPVLLRLLGAEAYGLIGFFAVLQIAFTTLDQALTTTATRELAAYRSTELDPAAGRSVLRSLEVVSWPVGVACGALVAGASGWLATNWLNTQELASSDVQSALIAGGIAIAVRWPASLYRGVLDGLELQVAQNTITAVAAAARILGGVAVVAFVEPSVVAFMAWQAIASCGEVVVLSAAAWSAMGGGLRRARVDKAFLGGVWRYATALNLIAILGLVITQVDRTVISYLLPLSSLGYYTIALTSAALIPHTAAAVAAAVLPRFAGAQAKGEQPAILGTYRQATEVVAYMAVGVAFTLAFFPEEILRAWIRSESAVDEASVVLVLLALAYLCNALYAIPYTLAVATGHVRVPLVLNLVAAPILVVVMITVVRTWGIVGAAAAGLTVMAAFFVAYTLCAHRLVLRGGPRTILVALARYVFLGIAAFGSLRIVASVLPAAGGYVCLGAAVLAYTLGGLALLPADVPLPRRWLTRPRMRQL